MNKRQKKKHKKKMELFINSWAFTYRATRELDRQYHEYCLMCERQQRCGHVFDIEEEWS